MKVVLTGGGTGGHIYPALAVGEALRESDAAVELLYIGGQSGPESEIVPAAGLPYRAISSKKLRSVVSPSTARVLFALWKGYRQATQIVKAFKPDVIIGTGGYVAAAAGMAAAHQGRPLIIQSCDAVPGRTNLWLSKRARKVCIWFDETARLLPEGKTAVTGVPLRRGVVSEIPSEEAREKLGMARDKPTILVLGGSQGARRLNEIVLGAAGSWSNSTQVLHQTGHANYEDVKAAVRGLKENSYLPRPYLTEDEMALAYAAADLVICRCGISTLAEVTANGSPALMVPYPAAYADHQTANARAVERAGGGAVMPESALTSESLASAALGLLNDRESLALLAKGSRAIGRPDAARHVANLAREVA